MFSGQERILPTAPKTKTHDNRRSEMMKIIGAALKCAVGLLGFFVFFVLAFVFAALEVCAFFPVDLINKCYGRIIIKHWLLTKTYFDFSNDCWDWAGLPG